MFAKIKYLVALISVFFITLSYSQTAFYLNFQDSIKPGYRISGKLDSVDTYIAEYNHTNPGFQQFNSKTFNLKSLTGQTYQNSLLRFSNIPHVAFRYSMGSNAKQFAAINYTQTIDSTTYVQFDYQRITSNGALRNSNYESNEVFSSINYSGKRFASALTTQFLGVKSQLNGGITGDTLDTEFKLIFEPVENETALVDQKNVRISWLNYLSIVKAKPYKYGVYLGPELSIKNQRYTEDNPALLDYDFIQIDSFSTNDLWQKSQISGSAGLFYASQKLSVKVGLDEVYWKYDNLIVHTDTVETILKSDLAFSLTSNSKLAINSSFTKRGAIGEKEVGVRFSGGQKRLKYNLQLNYQDKFPEVNQRLYYANNLNYSWTNKQLIQSFGVQGDLKIQLGKLPLNLSASAENVSNNAFFLDGRWRQDTISQFSLVTGSVSTSLRYKKVFLQPLVRFQAASVAFVPTFQASARFGFEGALFKAKKLKTAIGIEAGYCSTYALLDFNPLVNSYTLSASGKYYAAMPKLHVFANFDLGYFRWFVRTENIEQFFVKPTNMEALGFPVVPFQIRFGVSWDLFN